MTRAIGIYNSLMILQLHTTPVLFSDFISLYLGILSINSYITHIIAIDL